MDFFKKTKIFNFVKFSNYGLIFSVILILASLFLFFKVGFNLGIDFAGGSVAQVKYDKAVDLEKIRSLIESNPKLKGTQISEFGSNEEIVIKIPDSPLLANENLDRLVREALEPSGNFEIRKFDSVGAKIGDELKEKGIISLLLAFLAMMIYVSFRYEWRFALAGIVALIHDVVIVAASIIIFKIDMNLEVIAALLTLIGYSINDTIIIFDRIREKMLIDRSDDISLVINEAISVTLSRTLLTSLTVFFVLLTLYVFGGSVIVGFSLPMLVGVIVGTYSSMFVAPKLAILFGFSIKKYHEKEMLKQRKEIERQKLRAQYENGRVY